MRQPHGVPTPAQRRQRLKSASHGTSGAPEARHAPGAEGWPSGCSQQAWGCRLRAGWGQAWQGRGTLPRSQGVVAPAPLEAKCRHVLPFRWLCPTLSQLSPSKGGG